MTNGNPLLNENTFTMRVPSEHRMTTSGTCTKGFILFALLVAGAVYTWNLSSKGGNPMPWIWGGLIGGLVLCVITVFKKEWSPFTSPLYAIAEGLFIGAISYFFELQFEGIVAQAIALTFGVLFVMLALFQMRIIRVNDTFRSIIIASTGAIFLVYAAGWILAFFGISIPYIHGSGPIGIAFSLVVVGIASFNLLLDFDLIERGVQHGAPKYMEWFGAFALMVTLIWLYIEILRLLSKLRR